MYSNLMTFDIKTINKENIEEKLNTCLDVIKMIIELQKNIINNLKKIKDVKKIY